MPGYCSTGEGPYLQDAVVGELDEPNATAAAGGSLQILVHQFEDDEGVRQTSSHDRRKPSFLELQESSLKVVKAGELVQMSRLNIARIEQCVRPIVQEVGALADVFSCFLLQAVDENDILKKIV